MDVEHDYDCCAAERSGFRDGGPELSVETGWLVQFEARWIQCQSETKSYIDTLSCMRIRVGDHVYYLISRYNRA